MSLTEAVKRMRGPKGSKIKLTLHRNGVPELFTVSLARDVIRVLQDARKTDGLELADRVSVRWSTGDPELAAALAEHAELIAAEVLAADFAELRPEAADAGGIRHPGGGLPLEFWLQRAASSR